MIISRTFEVLVENVKLLFIKKNCHEYSILDLSTPTIITSLDTLNKETETHESYLSKYDYQFIVAK